MSLETDLIQRFFSQQLELANGVVHGIGDDAAIIEIPNGFQLAVSMDTLVCDVHFPGATTATHIGYKSLAVNLSDMAAMGAMPKWITLSLTLPDSDEQWIKEFMQGIILLGKQYSLSLIGGDLSQGPLSITIQIHGLLPSGKGLLRHAAKPGDMIYVTGSLGDAALALKLLSENKLGGSPDHEYLRNRLDQPEPRVELGMALLEFAYCAIDISDGLVSDLDYITRASNVGAEIQLNKIPLSDAYRKNNGNDLELALSGGDDYELCFTLPPDKSSQLEKLIMAGYRISCIGEIVSGTGIKWLDKNGKEVTVPNQGYSHF